MPLDKVRDRIYRCRNKFGMTRVILNSLPLRGNDKTVSGSKCAITAQYFQKYLSNDITG